MDLSASKPITVELPERATIFELSMTSPDEGWLVGGVFAPDFYTLESGLIMRYHDHQWRPIDDPLPIAFLDDIAMVSPDDGWVTGFSQDKSQSYLLRYTGGHWQQIAVPFQPADGKYYGGIRMLSPDEGWIVVNSASGWRGKIESLLLHYRNGAWTPVAVPTPVVWDYTPVGSGDLWLVGNASTLNRKDSVIAHFQQGQWSTTSAPGHVLLGTLHLQSADTGYVTGWQPEPPRGAWSSPPSAVVLQFDGTTWNPIQTGADPTAQEIVLFDQTDAWAFVKTHPESLDPPLPNDIISRVQHTASTIDLPWQAIDWPFTDTIGIHPMVRAAPGEYWAAAQYQVPPGGAGDFHWELLHFADGAWREYPPR